MMAVLRSKEKLINKVTSVKVQTIAEVTSRFLVFFGIQGIVARDFLGSNPLKL
jgi:hypothetical protein